MKSSSLHLRAKPPETAANVASPRPGPFISLHLLVQLRMSQLLEEHLPQAWHSAMVFRKNDVSLTFRKGKRGKKKKIEQEHLIHNPGMKESMCSKLLNTS